MMTETTSRPIAIAQPCSQPFKAQFESLIPLILGEWKTLQADLLGATEGDLDEVVDYIASETEHTRTLIRCQLAELQHLAQSQSALADRPAQNGNSRQVDTANSSDRSSSSVAVGSASSDFLSEMGLPTVEKTLQLLETRAEKLLGQVETELMPKLSQQMQEKVIPELNQRVREKPTGSLLTALGIGFLLGFAFGGWGRGRR